MKSYITKSRLDALAIPRGMNYIYIKCGSDYFEANNFQNEVLSKGLAEMKDAKFKLTDKGREYLKSLK